MKEDSVIRFTLRGTGLLLAVVAMTGGSVEDEVVFSTATSFLMESVDLSKVVTESSESMAEIIVGRMRRGLPAGLLTGLEGTSTLGLLHIVRLALPVGQLTWPVGVMAFPVGLFTGVFLVGLQPLVRGRASVELVFWETGWISHALLSPPLLFSNITLVAKGLPNSLGSKVMMEQ